MMEWTKNLISFCDSKDAGKCPKCKKDGVQVTEHQYGNRKSLTFYCKDCKASIHFDGVATK